MNIMVDFENGGKLLFDLAKGVINEKRTEIMSRSVENLAEIYNGMVDSKKDEFLKLTNNQ